MKFGLRYDETRGCVDRSDIVHVGFNGKGLQGGHYCLQRKADAAIYWTTTVRELSFDAEGWDACSSDDPAEIGAPPVESRHGELGSVLEAGLSITSSWRFVIADPAR